MASSSAQIPGAGGDGHEDGTNLTPAPGLNDQMQVDDQFGDDVEVIDAGNKGKDLTRKGKGKKRFRSWIWDHIDKNEDVDPPIAVCRYCQQVFPADSSKNGTGQMIMHLRRQCPKAPEEIKAKDPY